MIEIKNVDGRTYKNFKRIEVSLDMDNVAGSFSMVSSIDKDNMFPFEMNDYIEIYVDGEQVINGYIDELVVDYSTSFHDVKISGYSKIIDIVHSSIEKREAFKTPITLKQIAEDLLEENGMDETEVKIAEGVEIEKFEEEGTLEPALGETIFEFLEKLARKRQIILNSDEKGNLILTRGIGEKSSFFYYRLYNVVGGKGNNILSASLRRDNTDRYRIYKVHSGDDPINTGLTITDTEVNLGPSLVDKYSLFFDLDIRETRRLEMKAEESSNQQGCETRAKWEKNIRKTRSLNYSATVQGHSGRPTNEPYKINAWVRVIDDFCNIKGYLLIKKVVFNYSLDDGSTTTLECVLKDGYNIEASANDAAKAIAEAMGVILR